MASASATPSASAAFSIHSSVIRPVIACEPSIPPNLPSSSLVTAISIGEAGTKSASCMARTLSSATQAPSVPSKAPPPGTVSRCEPAITTGPSPSPEAPEDVAGAVPGHDQARLFHLRGEPAPRLHVGVGETPGGRSRRRSSSRPKALTPSKRRRRRSLSIDRGTVFVFSCHVLRTLHEHLSGRAIPVNRISMKHRKPNRRRVDARPIRVGARQILPERTAASRLM